MNHECNFDRILHAIKELQPDILCLNEVLHPFCNPLTTKTSSSDSESSSTPSLTEEDLQKIQEYYQAVKDRVQPSPIIDPTLFIPSQQEQETSFLHRLSKETNLCHVEYCGATNEHSFGRGTGVQFGNAILTTKDYPIHKFQHHVLQPEPNDIYLGNQQRTYVDPRVFSAYQIKIKTKKVSTILFGVGVVHLDHKSEELRQKQMQRGIHETQATLMGIPHFICGDMNTFQKSDGDDSTWNEICNLYTENNWPLPPNNSLVIELLQSKEYGYQDTYYVQQSATNKYPSPTAWTDRPLMRIDHVFVKNDNEESCSASSDGEKKKKIVIEKHFCGRDYDGSDHFPVIVDFRIE